MVLTCASQHLASFASPLSKGCLDLSTEFRRTCLAPVHRQNAEKRHNQKGTLTSRKGRLQLSENYLLKRITARKSGTQAHCRAGAREVRLHPCRDDNTADAPAQSEQITPSSNYSLHTSTESQDPKARSGFLLHFLRTAVLAIPLLFLLTAFSGPAFAIEPQTETLNSIIVPPGGGHLSLGQRIAVALRTLGLPDWVTILLVAALPVVELRGAIPVGYWLGLNRVHIYGLAVLGNMLPVPFVIAYVGKVSEWLVQRSSWAKKFFDWLFARTRSRADLLVKYRTLGLTLFVAVPLPLTGAWSGAIGAHLLGLPFWESIAANLVGVMIAGVIVTVLCELGWTGAVIAGVGLFTAAIAAFWTSRRKERAGEDPVV
jgi:uncharacterized membrane protein